MGHAVRAIVGLDVRSLERAAAVDSLLSLSAGDRCQLPGVPAKDNQREQEQKTQLGQNSGAVEGTEGLNQSDYLRRLARQMKEDNASWQRDDGFGIRAIGVLGSDIYDKLMILRALRPEFPGVLFFTNNYDAHFERHDDWDDTHDLIIASPFGTTLPDIYLKQHIAPFRDTNQTSTCIGTLVATGKMQNEEAWCLSWQPRIFEISRRGAYDLSRPWYFWAGGVLKIESHYDKNEKNKTWFRDWLRAPGVIRWLTLISLTVLAMAAWISLTIARRTLPGGGTALERLKPRARQHDFLVGLRRATHRFPGRSHCTVLGSSGTVGIFLRHQHLAQ
jgi:hypothetical protein